jgi:hypothetical protein
MHDFTRGNNNFPVSVTDAYYNPIVKYKQTRPIVVGGCLMTRKEWRAPRLRRAEHQRSKKSRHQVLQLPEDGALLLKGVPGQEK